MSGIDTKAGAAEVYGNSWYAATMAEAPARPPLSVDLDIDVCVIGGGLAGLTAAREIARRGWSVVLLEARRLAAQASGRNTGFVLPGFGADADKLVARVGFERTKNLWSLAQAGLDYVRTTIRADRLRGIDPRDGWLHVSKIDHHDEFVRDVALLGELGCEIEAWPTERVRAVLRSERYFYAVNYLRAFTIHPLNYALGLAAAAERDGARIFEGTPALAIDPTGVRKRIVTPGARLRADHVVLAGNVGLGGLMPRVAATLIPVTTYVITTASLGDRLAAAVGYGGGISDSDFADNHYRVVDGDRLMLSGRSTGWERDPRRYIKALTGDIRKTYPQLGEVEVDYAWAGTLGLTLHRMPQIGELGPGVWLASGFGGHGLNTTAMAGNIIARAIVDGDETWRQFTPFELVWAGGVVGRAAAQMRGLIKRLRASIAERRAKARELAQHRAALAEALRQEALPAEAAPQPANEESGLKPAQPPEQEPAEEQNRAAEAAAMPERETASAAAPAAPLVESQAAQPARSAESLVESSDPEGPPAAAPSKRKKRRRTAKAAAKP